MVWSKIIQMFVGFIILQILHKSYSSLSSKSFATDFCFNKVYLLSILAYFQKVQWGCQLKLNDFLPKIYVFHEYAKFSCTLTCTCSTSVLALWILTRTYLISYIFPSKTGIRQLYSTYLLIQCFSRFSQKYP